MPSPGLSTTWGRESWSPVLIEALSHESVLLRAGANRVVADGRVIHVPRLLVNPDADWVGELEELPSDAGDADVLELTPKKIGNVVSLSRESVEDSPVSELDAVGNAMVRGVATKVDARFFSPAAATAKAPAGIFATTLPSGGTTVDIDGLIGAVGVVEAAGGNANAIFISPADVTNVRKATVNGGFAISDPTTPGVERIAGATLYPTPALNAGEVLVADTRYIVLAVRRDASVDFSEDALFTSDGVAARVTMRVDWGIGDPDAFAVIGTPVAASASKSKS
jgi:HK97 family phage major capsid protein